MEKPNHPEPLPKKTLATPPPPTVAQKPVLPPNPASAAPGPESNPFFWHQNAAQTKHGDKGMEGVVEDGDNKEASKPHQPAGGSASGFETTAGEEPVTDLQKKLRRAERFGVSPVLSEEEKRNTRAGRFGTGSGFSGSKDIGGSEEQKKKARAERFGLKVESQTDEEAKKKARVEKFGGDTKLETLEEEKRKARAIRFSKSSNGSSQVSRQTNSDPKESSVANS